METNKQSFLSNLIGEKYETYRSYSLKVVLICVVVFVILLGLTFLCHSLFLSKIFNLISGYSLFSLVFIAAIILTLDIRVDADKDTLIYKLTIAWGILLLFMGLVVLIISDDYRKHYAFECTTFLVDESEGVYHYKNHDYCEYAQEADKLIEMKGYQIDKTYKLCDECEQWADDIEAEYDSHFFRE